MADEHEQSVTTDSSENENFNRTEKRIKDLSSKVEMTAQERDAERKAREEAEAKAAAAEKKAEFLDKFSDVSTRYQGASEFKDKIMEKVVTAGYSVEDATLSVLNAEGKLSPIIEPRTNAPAAGGSASTVIPTGDRGADQMTQQERREALLKANETGELADLIKNFGR